MLILPGESPIADVVEVLEPLKVGHTHTTSIGKEVRENHHTAFMEDPLSSDGRWTIGTFRYDLMTTVTCTINLSYAVYLKTV